MSLVRRSVKAAGVCAFAYGLVAGCGSSDDNGDTAPECPRGTETCPCHRDSSCDDGLICFSEVCVDAAPSDDPSGGRSAGPTGGRGGAPSNPGGGGAPSGGGEPAGGGAPTTGGSAEPGDGGASGGGGGTPATPQGGDDAGPSSTDGGEPGTSGGAASGGAASGGSGGTTQTGGRDSEPTGGRVERPSGTPTVLLLVDGSSSMFEPRTVWDAAFDALMSEDGPVNRLEDQIRFGFSLYRGAFAMHAETDEACADISSVDFAFDNYAAIKALYETLDDDYEVTVKWETPTGHAITRATEALLADAADGPRYIVLITDGNPNTCTTLDPQCGQDRAVHAVQRAWQQGIETFAIGLGDVVLEPLSGGCYAEISRCGPDHLQDLANAGQGQAVVEPPTGYQYTACVMETEEYLASYSAEGGDATAYSTTTPEELRSAIADVLDTIVEHSQ